MLTIALLSSLMLAQTGADVQTGCRTQALIDERVRRATDELRPLMEEQRMLAERRSAVLKANPLATGFKSLFDRNHDTAFLAQSSERLRERIRLAAEQARLDVVTLEMSC